LDELKYLSSKLFRQRFPAPRMNSAENVTDKEPDKKLCLWCSTKLTRVNSYQNVICEKCYRIVAGAGMTDEEIFRLAELGRRKNKDNQ
jgi:hypothetical protein